MTFHTDKPIHVRLDGKLYIVRFEDGEPRSIKVRKTYEPGRPWQALYDSPYWHHSAPLGAADSTPSRVIAAARLKRDG